jgi:hypothetical protein
LENVIAPVTLVKQTLQQNLLCILPEKRLYFKTDLLLGMEASATLLGNVEAG